MNATVELVDEVVESGDELVILRIGYMELLKQAAELDGFDSVGDWMLWFVTYWGSEMTAASKGDNQLAVDLMRANMKRAA